MRELAAEYARREVADALFQIMLRQPRGLTQARLLRALPGNLGASPGLVHMILNSDPRFVTTSTHCDLKARTEVVSSSFQVGVQRLISELGRPLEISAVAAFFASTTGKEASHYETVIGSLLEQGGPFVAVGNRLLPASWVLFPEGETEDDVLFYGDLDQDQQLAALRPRCTEESLRGEDVLETAVHIVSAAGQPVSNRVLDFLVWRLHAAEGPFDPLALLTAMEEDPRVYAAPGLQWVTGEIRALIAQERERLDREAPPVEEGPTIDLDSILATPLPPEHPGYFIHDRHLELIYELVNTSPQEVTVEELLSEVLELTPDHPDFVAAAHSVHDLLHDDPAVIEVTPSIFLGNAAIPAWVREVPSELVPFPGVPGEDVILRAEGLRPGLLAKLQDPFYEDVGDGEVTVSKSDMTSDETFYPLLYPHRQAGTMKLRKMDARFFGIEAELDVITALDAEGQAHRVWVNTGTGLLLGLRELYQALGAEAGALLAVTPGEAPKHFVFALAGEDDAVAISEARVEELKALRRRMVVGATSLYQVMRAVMQAQPEGMRFERLWAEVNVVCRATRLQIASLLSYYQCFRPKDAQGDNWAFAPQVDPQAVITGKDKFVVA